MSVRKSVERRTDRPDVLSEPHDVRIRHLVPGSEEDAVGFRLDLVSYLLALPGKLNLIA